MNVNPGISDISTITLTLSDRSADRNLDAMASQVRQLHCVERVRCLHERQTLEITCRNPASTLLRDMPRALRLAHTMPMAASIA